VSEVVSDVGATARTVRTTPLWVDAAELETGAITRGRTYGWHANGHLETKGAPGKFEEGYVYDTLGQLVAVTNAPTGLAEESYTYSVTHQRSVGAGVRARGDVASGGANGRTQDPRRPRV
jgi:hypothetical protein